MCAYVFLTEAELPPPRAIRREVSEAAEDVSAGVAEVMECVTEALMVFPDAYRAVVQLMKDRRAQRALTQRSP